MDEEFEQIPNKVKKLQHKIGFNHKPELHVLANCTNLKAAVLIQQDLVNKYKHFDASNQRVGKKTKGVHGAGDLGKRVAKWEAHSFLGQKVVWVDLLGDLLEWFCKIRPGQLIQLHNTMEKTKKLFSK